MSSQIFLKWYLEPLQLQETKLQSCNAYIINHGKIERNRKISIKLINECKHHLRRPRRQLEAIKPISKVLER